MNGSSGRNTLQQCIYCGKPIRVHLKQCPYCREAQSDRRPSRAAAPVPTGGQFRSGLLLILTAAAAHYFAGGYVAVVIPGPLRAVLMLLGPLLFLAGLAVSLRAVFLRLRA